MEIGKIKARNYEFNVVFTGGEYVFFNNWCGIAAVATRKGYDGRDIDTFVVTLGNDHLIGGSFGSDDAMLSVVKRYVNKNEAKYIDRDIVYEVEHKALHNAYVTMSVNYRD